MKRIRANGIRLDARPAAFGRLPEHHPDAPPAQLRSELEHTGALLLRGLVPSVRVEGARAAATGQLERTGRGSMAPCGGFLARDASAKHVLDDVAANPEVRALADAPELARFFDGLWGEPSRRMNHTWFRFVPPGHATLPHADLVYMGRGTRDLLTVWIPLGSVDLDGGPLAILEGSHRSPAVRRYAALDVERSAELQRTRLRHWRRVSEGKFSANPRGTQRQLGGRWLTATFAPGDAVVFTAETLHCTLDNASAHTRLSIDTRFQRARDPMDPRWS